jgi:hypothetical protein
VKTIDNTDNEWKKLIEDTTRYLIYEIFLNEAHLRIVLGEGVGAIDAPADGSPVQRIPWAAAGIIVSLELSQTCEQVSFEDSSYILM